MHQRAASYLNLQPRKSIPQPALPSAVQVTPRPGGATDPTAKAPDRHVICGTTILSGDVAVDPGVPQK